MVYMVDGWMCSLKDLVPSHIFLRRGDTGISTMIILDMLKDFFCNAISHDRSHINAIRSCIMKISFIITFGVLISYWLKAIGDVHAISSRV